MAIQTQAMTEGPLAKKILFFSIPLMFSNLLQVLFTIADIAVVGQFVGSEALGSVGSTTTLVTLFTTVLIGVAGGINVLVAHAIGAKNNKEIEEVIHTAALISLMAGGLIMLLGMFFARPALILMNTKPELLEGAVLYFKIYFLGMPALALYNFGNAVLSAAGDTKKPLLFLAIAGCVNILLNLFLIVVCHMGVAGVAIASIAAQYISAILIIRTLITSKEIFRLCIGKLHFTMSRVRAILAIGVPAGLQNAIFQVGNLFVQVSVNHFDAVMVAGNSVASNADSLVYDVMAAFYAAGACFIGQNYGAGKKKRILKSYFICLIYSFGIGFVMGIALILMGPQFLGIFTKDAAVVEAGMQRLVIMGVSYAISALMDCTIAASRGMGKSVVPMFIVIMGSCVFRIVWVYTIFAHFQTIASLYLLYSFSWSITAIAEIVYFSRIYKKVK